MLRDVSHPPSPGPTNIPCSSKLILDIRTVMAQGQKIRTWFFGFRLGKEEALALAKRVLAQPGYEDSERLSKIVQDVDEITPSDELYHVWQCLDTLDNWADAYVQEATGLDVLTMRQTVAIPLPNSTEETKFTICSLIKLAKRRAVDPLGLKVEDCPEYREDICERLRQILPDDKGGWYQDFMERSAVGRYFL